KVLEGSARRRVRDPAARRVRSAPLPEVISHKNEVFPTPSLPLSRGGARLRRALIPVVGRSGLDGASPQRSWPQALNRSRRRESAPILCLQSQQVRRITPAAARVGCDRIISGNQF